MILLTATPHSGIESAFRSLLALLRPQFGSWNISTLTEPQRIALAQHFVQRTRRDIEHDWEGEHCFLNLSLRATKLRRGVQDSART